MSSRLLLVAPTGAELMLEALVSALAKTMQAQLLAVGPELLQGAAGAAEAPGPAAAGAPGAGGDLDDGDDFDLDDSDDLLGIYKFTAPEVSRAAAPGLAWPGLGIEIRCAASGYAAMG